MRVAVVGGGAIGTSIAYFLARRGAEVTLIERTAIACAASGKSGGFLALDWCDGTPLQALARRSFQLHAELAEKLGGEAWGYRRMTTYGGYADARSGETGSPGDGRAAGRCGERVGWVSGGVAIDRRLGTPETTAQVHPQKFTQAMMRAAEDFGATLLIATVAGMRLSADGSHATGVELASGKTLQADAVVIAMGPWSIQAAAWLPIPRIFGLKGHSLVFETGADIPAEALFLEFAERNGAASAPEIFPRADGTTYVCGISSESPVPEDPAGVTPDPGALDRLEAICRDISPHLAAAKVLARQACYRPVTANGLPLIGAVPGVAGAYVATGHSVWGILNAPATGEAMAEMVSR
jgi:glycine/D-amino acid oxidase-like deaminating enzyme